MKKTSKLFGAVALSAALALGTATPAFAAFNVSPTGGTGTAGEAGVSQDYVGKTGDMTDAQKPHTDLSLKVTTTQINATLPLKMQVVADIDGGLITFPTPAKYQIINNNDKSPLYINEIKGELKAGWENAQANPTNLASLNIPSLGTPTSSNNGCVYMEIGGSGDKATNKVILAGNNLATNNTTTLNALPWVVAKATNSTTPTKYSLTLKGATSPISGLTTDDAAKDLISITYTVSAAPAADVVVDGGAALGDTDKSTNV